MFGVNERLDTIVELLEKILCQGEKSYSLILERDRNSERNHLKWLKRQVAYYEELIRMKEEFESIADEAKEQLEKAKEAEKEECLHRVEAALRDVQS